MGAVGGNELTSGLLVQRRRAMRRWSEWHCFGVLEHCSVSGFCSDSMCVGVSDERVVL